MGTVPLAHEPLLEANVRFKLICDVRLVALRNTSASAPPCGTIVGHKLLNVIGPPVTRVMVPNP